MTGRVGGVLAVSVLWVVFVLPGVPLAGAAASTTVPTRTEAWYDVRPGCSSPLDCVPAPLTFPHQDYPPDTLHVSATAGQESARTYLTLDSSRLRDKTASAGTLRLPVATDAGTANPASAKLAACFATGPISEQDGGAGDMPSVDCEFIRVPLRDAGTASRPAFTVNLAPFLREVNGQVGDVAIAVMADPETTGPADTWHIAFNGRDRDVPDDAKIAATVAITGTAPPPAPSAAGTDVASVPRPAPAELPSIAGDALPSVGTAGVPAPQPAEAPELAPASRQPPEPVLRAWEIPGGRYGIVWALPLALLGLAWLCASTGTRDLRSLAR